MKRRLAAALLTLAAIATGAAGIGGSAFAEETNWFRLRRAEIRISMQEILQAIWAKSWMSMLLLKM